MEVEASRKSGLRNLLRSFHGGKILELGVLRRVTVAPFLETPVEKGIKALPSGLISRANVDVGIYKIVHCLIPLR
jgi:hypothetical protein